MHPDEFNVVALTAHKNKNLLFEQVKKYKPQFAALSGETQAFDVPDDLKFCTFLYGEESLSTIAKNADYNYVIVSVVGMVGLKSVLDSIKLGKRVLLANKEALVAGGKIVIDACKKASLESKNNSSFVLDASFENNIALPSPLNRILPIDSEHSAIFQCMNSNSENKIKKIYLTCSGGPFREWNIEQINNASVEQALNHPKWNMGKKISVDSASLFNKALEIIEAKWLFDVDESNIDVVIHPQSIVHSMVGFDDGAIIAQLGEPSMKVPIAYSLAYPKRIKSGVSLPDICSLEMYKPDVKKFESLNLVRHCIRQNDASCAIFNAANEQAVEEFLNRKILFVDIVNSVKYALNNIKPLTANSFEEVVYADSLARQEVKKFIKSRG